MERRGGLLRGGAHLRHPFFKLRAAAAAGQLFYAVERKPSASQRHGLLRQRERVAQRAVGLPRELPDGLVLSLDVLLRADVFQPVDGVGYRYSVERYVLAARAYRDGDLVRLRRREKEYDVRRRLLQRFEQRVEGLLGEHVDFVYDVDLVGRGERLQVDVALEVAYLADAAVRRAVYLYYVEVFARRYCAAVFADAARLAVVLAVQTVERFRD